jgi:hypothetical protein
MTSDPNSPRRAALAEALRACGLVDTHYHVGPELLPRRYNVAGLAAAAAEWRATLVLKNHTYPTTPLASLARAEYGARFVGSVVLNRFVGGLNPDAVAGALSGNRTRVEGDGGGPAEPPLVVWMPTVHAASHLRTLGHAFDPRWSGCCGEAHAGGGAEEVAPVEAFDDALRPRPELLRVIEAIARSRGVLATGHLSSDEIMRLVPLALDCGVPSVIITHPHYPSVALSDERLRLLTRDPRVFVEHCFAVHTIEGVPLEQIADSVRATGPEQVIIASDFGQVCSEPFPGGTALYAFELQRLLGAHLGGEDFLGMFSRSGARALGLGGQGWLSDDRQTDRSAREAGAHGAVPREPGGLEP